MPKDTRALSRRRLASLLLAALATAAVALPGVATATSTSRAASTTSSTATATTTIATAAAATPTTALTASDAAVDGPTLSALESDMVAALNADRRELGLVPVVVDARLMAIARARSNDMVAKDYFGHVQPDGRNVFDILTAKRVTWYTAGEIIAWNNYDLSTTVEVANRQWLNSPSHYAILSSASYNYIGVGLAIDASSGKNMWTAVYLKGPDRTAARAAAASPRMGTWRTTKSRAVTISWSGYDPRLQVLTSGFRSFTLQRRVDGGSWVTLTSSTTRHAKTFAAWKGHVYEFRVRARDRAGNGGSWVPIVVDIN